MMMEFLKLMLEWGFDLFCLLPLEAWRWSCRYKLASGRFIADSFVDARFIMNIAGASAFVLVSSSPYLSLPIVTFMYYIFWLFAVIFMFYICWRLFHCCSQGKRSWFWFFLYIMFMYICFWALYGMAVVL